MTDLDKLEALAKAATQGPWKGRQPPYSEGATYIEAELPCINGLSAWFSVALVPAPSEEEVGYSDGAIDGCSNAAFIAAANPATILSLIASAREAAAEIEKLKEAWKLCEEMVKAEDDLIADLVNDERYLDAMKMDFPITNRMRSMLARAAQMDGEG